jgi:hypothetical protein
MRQAADKTWLMARPLRLQFSGAIYRLTADPMLKFSVAAQVSFNEVPLPSREPVPILRDHKLQTSSARRLGFLFRY